MTRVDDDRAEGLMYETEAAVGILEGTKVSEASIADRIFRTYRTALESWSFSLDSWR